MTTGLKQGMIEVYACNWKIYTTLGFIVSLIFLSLVILFPKSSDFISDLHAIAVFNNFEITRIPF